MNIDSIHTGWLVSAASIAMLLQIGFCCFESGLVRSKNSIHAAMKNLIVFCLASTVFFSVGFGIMFGTSQQGFWGKDGFFLAGFDSTSQLAFFMMQLVCCATTASIVTGAVAERMRFYGYVLLVALIAGVVYPVLGHWIWSSGEIGMPGWLAAIGFIDFAGATLIHGTAGWAALAAALVIGPRVGRFADRAPRITGHNLPFSVMGVMLIWIGWIGLCAGRHHAFTDQVALIATNLTLAAAFGGLVALLISWIFLKSSDVLRAMNGVIAGLVAISASCNMVTPAAAVLIGITGSSIGFAASSILEKMKIDDVTGAFPSHACAGIWGTLAVAIFGNIDFMAGSATRLDWLVIQATGCLVCFAWVFGVSYPVLWCVNRFADLRVPLEDERMGLNVSEHNASTEILDLLFEIESAQHTADSPAPDENRHTEAGQIAALYQKMANSAAKEKEAAKLIRKSESRFRRIIDTANDAFIALDEKGTIQRWNVAAENIFGWSYDQAVGQTLQNLLIDEASESKSEFKFYQALIKHAQDGTHFEWSTVHQDGHTIPVEISASIAADTEQLSINLFARDISQRIELQQSLARSQKLESIGQMAAGVAHEINTPTQFVGDNTRFLKDAFSDLEQVLQKCVALMDAKQEPEKREAIIAELETAIAEADLEFLEEEIPAAIEQSLEGVDRVAKIVQAMKQFSHPGSAAAASANVNEIIDNAITVSRGEWKHRCSIETRLDHDLPPIECFENEISQLLLNMIVNATHAVVERWKDSSIKHGQIAIMTQSNQDGVEIRIGDNGCGIPEDRIHRIFDPFFTTKPVGQGTGQGLTIAFKVAERHGGSIDVQSTVDEGTEFTIRFPFQVPNVHDPKDSVTAGETESSQAESKTNPIVTPGIIGAENSNNSLPIPTEQ